MKEIGSEFWDVPLTKNVNSVVPNDCLWFLSGRYALQHILKTIKKENDIKKAAVPSWCCDSMIKPFLLQNIEVEFYPVYLRNSELVQEIPENAQIILVMDYFGFSSNKDYSNYPGIVIRDLTHSLFIKNYNDADYYFGSFRKWCGIWTGGFAWSLKHKLDAVESEASINYVGLRKKAMELKADYISGIASEKTFLNLFGQAEDILDELDVVQCASDRDIDLIKRIDTDFIKQARRNNAQILIEELRDITLFGELKDEDCPLFVPIIVENRDKLRKKLIDNNIYCPVHWPVSQLHTLTEKTELIYNKEISLICDQRYSENDMRFISKIIRKGV